MVDLDFEDAFEQVLTEALEAPDLEDADRAELQAVARRWRVAIQRRTGAEHAAYLRARAEQRELEARRDAYQNANGVLAFVAILLAALLGLAVYAVWSTLGTILGVVLAALVLSAGGLVGWLLAAAEERQGLRRWRVWLRPPDWSAAENDRLNNAPDRVGDTRATWLKALKSAVLARLWAHGGAAPFSLQVADRDGGRLPAGLLEALDASFHVQTETGRRLARLIRDIQGGSFALVGARGSGKSDLLAALELGAYADAGVAPLLTAVLPAPVSYVPREFMLQFFSRTCARTVEFVDTHLEAGTLPWALASELRALRQRARAQRQEVLHQQTTSLEAAAEASAPAWSLGVRRGVSRSRLAYTYPELVSEVRDFLEHLESVLQRYADHQRAQGKPAALEGGVALLVAIDELDRIEDAGQARAFLQELRGLLGVRNCCVIVATAEEALRAFEDADSPLADTLDRAFDEIVHMTHLDLATCTQLLASRAGPRFSECFSGLCYCMAGGVARNVIRSARSIAGSGGGGEQSLAAVTATLVEDELRELVNWARTRLAAAAQGRSLASVRLLDGWAHKPLSGAELRSTLVHLVALPAPAPTAREAAIRDQAAATACFLITVLDVFGERVDPDRYRQACSDQAGAGSFRALARARRRLSVNHRLAREMLDAFREVWRLPPLG